MPSISALIVLDALARRGSVRAAAADVHLSQSAVSHKLKALETQLGFKLTEGVVLTGEARRYVTAIRPALAILREAHSALDQAKGSLEIAVASGFAATWLAPRLSDFLNRYPEISLKLRSVASGETVPECDLGIVFTDSPPKGSKRLFEVTFFPVCSPDFLVEHNLHTAAQITPNMLLHLETQADWAHWLGMKDKELDLEKPGLVFTGLLAMNASAEAGMGLCLGDAVTADHALQSGRLVRPFAEEIPARASYWITPSPGGFTAPAAAFAEWLQEGFLASQQSSFAADDKNI